MDQVDVYGNVTIDANASLYHGYIHTGGRLVLQAGATTGFAEFSTTDRGGELVFDTRSGPFYIVDFMPGDKIDLANLAYSATGTVSGGGQSNSITISENGASAHLNFGTLYAPVSISNLKFVLSPDDSGGTLVTVAYPSAQPHANDISRSDEANLVDLPNLEASYTDLIHAFGINTPAMQNWYNTQQPIEKRSYTFDGLDYVASYSDLIGAFRSAGSEQAVRDAGALHFIGYGANEGRTTTFNGLDYIASFGDLIKAFGANGDAGAYHFIEAGAAEGRQVTFDGLDYIASYTDLIKAFGANEQTGALHYIVSGHNEGRTTTFDGLDYIAGYTDLMNAFGANNDAGATHYITNGLNEGRSAHPFDVGVYESAHPDLIGKYASNDAFLTAYINTYTTTGNFLL